MSLAAGLESKGSNQIAGLESKGSIYIYSSHPKSFFCHFGEGASRKIRHFRQKFRHIRERTSKLQLLNGKTPRKIIHILSKKSQLPDSSKKKAFGVLTESQNLLIVSYISSQNLLILSQRCSAKQRRYPATASNFATHATNYPF